MSHRLDRDAGCSRLERPTPTPGSRSWSGFGDGIIPGPDTVMQEGDRVYVVTTDATDGARGSVLARGPEAS